MANYCPESDPARLEALAGTARGIGAMAHRLPGYPDFERAFFKGLRVSSPLFDTLDLSRSFDEPFPAGHEVQPFWDLVHYSDSGAQTLARQIFEALADDFVAAAGRQRHAAASPATR